MALPHNVAKSSPSLQWNPGNTSPGQVPECQLFCLKDSLSSNSSSRGNPIGSYLYTVLKYTSTLPPAFTYREVFEPQRRYARALRIMSKQPAGRIFIIALPPTDFVLDVKLGTPGKALKLSPDTGSTDTWVWSSKLPSILTNSVGKHHALYDQAQSTSSLDDDKILNIEYADGSKVMGCFAVDDLRVGRLNMKQQHIGLPTWVSEIVVEEKNDGILGLGLSELKSKGTTSFVENFSSSQNSEVNQVFTAHYDTATTAQHSSSAGFYTFGFIDQSILRKMNVSMSEINYAPIHGDSYWKVSSESWSLEATSHTRSGNEAVIDTGCGSILTESSVCNGIYESIHGSKSENGIWMFPSGVKDENLPAVAFDIGGKEFTVPKSHIRLTESQKHPGWVVGGIQPRCGIEFDVLGIPFLNGIYAIFDCKNKRFGALQR